jgi:hypothetical protein
MRMTVAALLFCGSFAQANDAVAPNIRGNWAIGESKTHLSEGPLVFSESRIAWENRSEEFNGAKQSLDFGPIRRLPPSVPFAPSPR